MNGGSVWAVRAHPSVRRAVAVRREARDRPPSLSDWVLARLAGDAEFERWAAGVFAREDLGLMLAIRARLQPTSQAAGAELALFQSRSAAPGTSEPTP